MSIFNRIFKSSKTADDIFDKDKGLLAKFGGWVGNSKFTEEERAEMNHKTVENVQQFVKDTLDENTERSKARRTIAENSVDFYFLTLFMGGMIYPFNKDWSDVWLSIAFSATLGGLVVAISIFFFGSHALVRHNKSKKG